MSTTLTEPAAEPSIFDQRREARRRAWICPGAGFGLFGSPVSAALAYLTGAATLLAAIWTAWTPSATPFWTSIAFLAVSTIVWIAELALLSVMWPQRSPGFFAQRYRLGAVVIWLLVAVFVVVVVSTYRTMEVLDVGMEPTVPEHAHLLYRLRVGSRDLPPGTLVLFKLSPDSKYEEPGKLVLGRILAGPGDLLSVKGGRYYVNGEMKNRVASAGQDLVSLHVTAEPGRMPVSDGRYFIVQDSSEGNDSRVFSWARAEDVLSTQFWSLSWSRPLERIE